MRSLSIIVGLAITAGSCSTVVASDITRPAKPWASSDVEAIKNAVVSGILLSRIHPELTRDPEAQAPLWRIQSLFVLFLGSNDDKVLTALGDLNSYRTDGALSELLRCVQVQAGPAYQAKLKRLLDAGSNDCQRNSTATAKGICLSSTEFKNRLLEVIESRTSGRRCEVEP